MKRSGVYLITNEVNRHKYVGSSSDLYVRKGHHFSDLRGNRHRNQHLQRAFNKYGEGSFSWEILEECLPDILNEREKYYIDLLVPEYNILSIPYSTQGYKHTPESKRLIGQASSTRVRRRWTEEEKRLQSEKFKGRILAPKPIEWIRKIVSKTKGLKRSSESIKRISIAKLGNDFGAKEYTLISPEGDEIHIVNLKQYCRDYQIDYHIRERKYWKGWILR